MGRGMATSRGESKVDRDNILRAARDCFEGGIWALLTELEKTLAGLARAEHVDLSDLRAVGSVLNSALMDAAETASVCDLGLRVVHVRNGRSNKIEGVVEFDGRVSRVSFELHLCGPQGGTSKEAHQFAGFDIEAEPTLPGFRTEAPEDVLLFVACNVSGSGTRISRAFLKFADGVDRRKIELHRDIPAAGGLAVHVVPLEKPVGPKITIRKPKGKEAQDGSKTAQWGDAASSSQET